RPSTRSTTIRPRDGGRPRRRRSGAGSTSAGGWSRGRAGPPSSGRPRGRRGGSRPRSRPARPGAAAGSPRPTPGRDRAGAVSASRRSRWVGLPTGRLLVQQPGDAEGGGRGDTTGGGEGPDQELGPVRQPVG